jgi:hypothetical protein
VGSSSVPHGHDSQAQPSSTSRNRSKSAVCCGTRWRSPRTPAFLRNVHFHPRGDAEGGEWSAWVAAVVAERGGEVDRPSPAERADDEVA